MNDCTDIYNLTNNYIKLNLTNDNKKSLINFFNIRKILKNDITNVCKINKLNKHTGDYAVKHCIEMYKSAIVIIMISVNSTLEIYLRIEYEKI